MIPSLVVSYAYAGSRLTGSTYVSTTSVSGFAIGPLSPNPRVTPASAMPTAAATATIRVLIGILSDPWVLRLPSLGSCPDRDPRSLHAMRPHRGTASWGGGVVGMIGMRRIARLEKKATP